MNKIVEEAIRKIKELEENAPCGTTSVHMIYADDEIRKGLGYHQLNFYAPIKLKNNI